MYAFVVQYITLFHYPPVVIFFYLFMSYFCCNSARFYFFIIFKLFIIENFFSSNLHVCLFLWLYRSIENLFHVGPFCLVRRGPSAPSCMCKWPPIHLSLSLVAMLYCALPTFYGLTGCLSSVCSRSSCWKQRPLSCIFITWRSYSINHIQMITIYVTALSINHILCL